MERAGNGSHGVRLGFHRQIQEWFGRADSQRDERCTRADYQIGFFSGQSEQERSVHSGLNGFAAIDGGSWLSVYRDRSRFIVAGGTHRPLHIDSVAFVIEIGQLVQVLGLGSTRTEVFGFRSAGSVLAVPSRMSWNERPCLAQSPRFPWTEVALVVGVFLRA